MEIQTKQRQMAEKLIRKHGLGFAVIFGSQANGNARENSDLDIGILDPKPETYRRYGELFNDFSKIFKGINVDLRMIKGAEPVFLYNALCKGKFLAGEKQSFLSYQAFAYKNFIDSKPLFDLKMKLLLKRQKVLNKITRYVK